MMMLASDNSHTNFTIQQYDSYLQVWLNRPGSDINGAPPITIPDALQAAAVEPRRTDPAPWRPHHRR